MTVPGSAVLASGSAVQLSLAEEAGRRIVGLVSDDVRPSSLLTPPGFGRAMTVLAAGGGSTNSIIHLCAVAGRRGLSLPLSSFSAVAARVPVMLDVAPVGTGLVDDLARAGGVPTVLAALAGEPTGWPLVSSGVTSLPAFMVVRGNLAPDGAVIKAAAAAGPISAKAAMAASAASTTPAWARSSGSVTTERGSRSSPDGAPGAAGGSA